MAAGLGATAVILLAVAAPVKAQATYVRIEEDWYLELLSGDSNTGGTGAPHVIVQMAPSPSSSFTGIFQINHREFSPFATGGLQVQLWKNNVNLSYKSYGTALVPTTGEKLIWTQYMSRDATTLTYGIKGAKSTTWGDISAGSNFYVSTPDPKPIFDSYSSDYGPKNSAVTLGATRVKMLMLIDIRKYKSDGSYDLEVPFETVFP